MKALHILYVLFFLLNVRGFDCFSQQVGFTPVPPPVRGWGSNIISGSQDPKGYMWFGASGLHRYDGYNYKSYFHDPMDPSSLVYNRTEVVVADHNGFVWVGTNGMGLDRLDPETGIFTHFRHSPSDPNSISNDRISAILEDRDGKIWVGTEHAGLNCIDPKTGTITRFRHNPSDNNTLSFDKVTALYEDRQGTIWIGTGYLWHGGDLTLRDSTLKLGGLNRFNRTTKNFTRYLHDPNDPSSLIDNRVKSIFEDSKGTLWVGTSGDGLHTMNREKGSFERHRYNALDPKKLSRSPVKSTMPWADDMITFIREDAAGTIWIGTLMGGLNRYDPQTRKIKHYTSLDENSKDKEPLAFWWSYTSKDGVLWILTWQGVYRMDPFHKQIPHYDVGSKVTNLLQDKAGKLWLGSDNLGIANQGLICYDADRVNKKRFAQDTSDLTSLSSNIVYSMFEDSRGTVWIGTQNGLSHYDRRTQKFTRYLSSGHNYGITAIYEDRAGLFWLGTNVGNEGLVLMNRKNGTFTHYKEDTTDAISLRYRAISCIKEDKAGNLWLGTFAGGGGLKSFDRNAKKFQHYIQGANIWEIFEDAEGVLWIGTNKGLYYFNRSNNRFAIFHNQAAGLTEDIEVYGILQDNQQSLWVTSNIGLFRLRHNASEISLFGERRGISPRSIGFKGNGGELFFGSDNGYYAFFPEQLTGNTNAPDLHTTGFRLGDQLVYPGKASPLSLPISETREIHLSYDQNVFSFDFAGIHYSSPEDNQHLFMLENFNNTWKKAGEEKTADYYNVPPGHYIFRVKAANSDGVWTEKSIAIIISPPLWKTGWAYFMYGVLFIAGVLATHRVQKARVIKAERDRTREKELAQAKEIEKAYHELKTTQAQLVQREKMASLGELTAGIAHEIQNPLNFVNNFSELSNELIDEMNEGLNKGDIEEAKAIASDVKNNLEKINLHGKRADAIVKGMLQHSKSRSGAKEPTDINTLADEYLRLSYHGFRAKDKSFNVKLNTDYDQTIGPIKIIPQDIGRVILNLVNNAFYAVSAKASSDKSLTANAYEPTVSVSTKKIGDKIEIRVIDNGNGIPSKILDKIFQPFFTTKPTGQGTGLGLSLAYDIVKAHGGELKVKTPGGANGQESEGAEFIIYLPLK
jgi:ligand-binding sensor domain-containing protein/signal transduction histidine kinase